MTKVMRTLKFYQWITLCEGIVVLRVTEREVCLHTLEALAFQSAPAIKREVTSDSKRKTVRKLLFPARLSWCYFSWIFHRSTPSPPHTQTTIHTNNSHTHTHIHTHIHTHTHAHTHTHTHTGIKTKLRLQIIISGFDPCWGPEVNWHAHVFAFRLSI